MEIDREFVAREAGDEPMTDADREHKCELNDALGRNVGVAVAALDYFSNVKNELDYAVLLDEDQVALVADLATRDAMTGLYDHSTFQLTLRREIQRAHRYPKKVSVIMTDVDHFKRFNDEHGHPAGDRVLETIAREVRRQRPVPSPCPLPR